MPPIGSATLTVETKRRRLVPVDAVGQRHDRVTDELIDRTPTDR